MCKHKKELDFLLIQLVELLPWGSSDLMVEKETWKRVLTINIMVRAGKSVPHEQNKKRNIWSTGFNSELSSQPQMLMDSSSGEIAIEMEIRW